MKNVFISRPTYIDPKFRSGLDNFLNFLEGHNLKPRTIGANEYPTKSPLDEVIRVMKQCSGAIILGYPQIYVSEGFLKDQKIPSKNLKKLYLPTEWNHIETGLAYAMNLPLLVIHHLKVSRGIFDRGATNSFIYEIDLSNSSWPLLPQIQGAFTTWKRDALNLLHFSGLDEKTIDYEYAKMIRLTEYLDKQGYRLSWVNPKNLQKYIDLCGYERVTWVDQNGKEWLLTAPPDGGNGIPLKTKLTELEVKKLKEKLKEKK